MLSLGGGGGGGNQPMMTHPMQMMPGGGGGGGGGGGAWQMPQQQMQMSNGVPAAAGWQGLPPFTTMFSSTHAAERFACGITQVVSRDTWLGEQL